MTSCCSPASRHADCSTPGSPPRRSSTPLQASTGRALARSVETVDHSIGQHAMQLTLGRQSGHPNRRLPRSRAARRASLLTFDSPRRALPFSSPPTTSAGTTSSPHAPPRTHPHPPKQKPNTTINGTPANRPAHSAAMSSNLLTFDAAPQSTQGEAFSRNAMSLDCSATCARSRTSSACSSAESGSQPPGSGPPPPPAAVIRRRSSATHLCSRFSCRSNSRATSATRRFPSITRCAPQPCTQG